MILLRRLRVHAFKQLANIDIEFPRRGAILVEGANESGKSTLFEAIFFALYGRPLVGEDERPVLDDVIPHDGASAYITLHVISGDVELEIRRTVTRGRAGKNATQKVLLRVSRPGEPVEEIATARAADDRIEQELHGLNGDTLRNSCLMEQKALDRIEALDRERREASIARLLGIGQIQKIEKDLDRTRQARAQQLARCQAECAVAEARQAATAAERAEAEAAERFHAARVRALLDQRDRRDGNTSDSLRTDAELQTSRQALMVRLEEVARLQRLRDATAAASAAVERALQADRAGTEARARLDDLNRLEREQLPPLRSRLETLTAAASALSTRDAAQSRLSALERLVTAAEAAAQARQAEAEAEQALVSAHTESARLTTGVTLSRWARLKETETLIHEESEQRNTLAKQRQALAARNAAAHATARRTLLVGLLLALLTLACGVAGILIHLAWIPAALLLALTIVFAVRLSGAHAATREARTALAGIERAESEAHARREMALRLAGSLDELPRLEADLRAAGLSVPDSPAAALATVAALPDSPSDPESAEAARRALDEARLARERRRAAREAMDTEVRAAKQQVAPNETDLDDLRAARAALETARRERAAAEADLHRHLEALDVAPNAPAIAAARGATKQEQALIVAQLARREALVRECESLAASHLDAQRVANAALAALNVQAREVGIELPPATPHLTTSDEVPPLTASPTRDGPSLEAASLDNLSTKIDARLAALDEPGARIELGRIEERLSTLARERNSASLSRDEQIVQIQNALAEQGIACAGDEPFAMLAGRWPALVEAQPGNVEMVERALQEARGEAHHQRERAAELARQHHLDGEELDAGECRERLHAIARDLRRHELALEMAQTIRANIVRRVIPETAVYMRSLLPELTAGRYRDVRLQSADTGGADLRLHVWDQLAGRYVAKNLFSGGTRDQCSLALRLAFALATLPKELGAMPGFIFLDEPLSSFDAERSRALVHILTRGTIAHQFSQVILISHSQSFERDSMRYHVRMAGGRIAATNLPSAREAAALWDAEAAIAAPTL